MNNEFYYKKDRLNQLRGFCSTVESGCLIGMAARKMDLEQPTISKQIMALERDLGVELFDRKSKYKKLILTKEGRMCYENACGLLRGIDGLFSCLHNDIKKEKELKLNIASNCTIFSQFLPVYIKRFKELYGDKLKFTLSVFSLEEAKRGLLDGVIDLAIYPMEHQDSELSSSLIYDLEPVVLMNKNNSLSLIKDKEIMLNDLLNQNFMVTDSDKVLLEYHRIKDNCDIEFKNVNAELIANFVNLNLGIQLCYNKFIFNHSDLVIKNVSHIFSNIKIYIMTKRGVNVGKNVNNFIDIIRRDFL